MKIIAFVIFYAIIGIIIAKLAVLVSSKVKFSDIYKFFLKL
ncbi:hypothetical protein [Clostridium sp. FP1]|nr:hypothetical protein [Clostridium sp. FP1]